MKTKIRKLFLVPALIAGLGFILTDRATALTYLVLTNFTGNAGSAPGGYPNSGLTLSGSTLYGTATFGGSSGFGTVFKVNTDGSGYTVLTNFTGNAGTAPGANPASRLTLSGSTLYGTTYGGGSSGKGTVFKINIDGSGHTVLKNFTDNPEGAYPYAGPTLSGETLYGTTYGGGASSQGTVFKINTNGSGYTVLVDFTGGAGAKPGRSPYAGLTLSGETLYGTTYDAGSSGFGTVFKVNTNGTGYVVLKNFALGAGEAQNPRMGVTLSGSTLYGATLSGGSSTYGTVFQIETNGSGYAVVVDFTGSVGAFPGKYPYYGELALSGGTLYGTTYQGGSSDQGTVFQVNTDGSGYTVLKDCTTSDGEYPSAGVTLSGSTLYGTTVNGGAFSQGTVFKLNLLGCPTITVSPMLLPDGISGEAYSQTIGASGGTAPYTFEVTLGSLPPELTLSSGGLLSGTPTNVGDYNFTVTATDSEDCTGSLNYDLTVKGMFLVAAKDDVVPTTPAGGKFSVFGIPSRNNSGNVAFRATLLNLFGGVVSSNNLAIYAGAPGAETLIVRSSDFAPDASGTPTAARFKSFSDPVYNNAGEVAFRGILKSGVGGVITANDTGLWSNAGGTMHLVAREGDVAPDTGGATFSSFTSFALPDTGDVVFWGVLTAGTGSPAVGTGNKTGIWAYDSSVILHKLTRTGDSVLVNSVPKTLKTLTFLPAVAYSPGQSRSVNNAGGKLIYKATFTDATSAILGANLLDMDPTFLVAAKEDVVPATPAGAKFSVFGIPSRNNSGNVAFRATLLNLFGGVVSSNNLAIYAGAPGAEALIVRSSDFAPDASGAPTAARFKSFSDPVYNNAGEVAFRGMLKSGIGGVITANDTGLWSNAGGTMHLVAREGDAAPDTGGATFSSFTSFALPDTGDVVFWGVLTAGTGSPAVGTGNKTGIWAYDSSVILHKLTRTGDSVLVNSVPKTLKTLTFLPAVAYSPGQSRSVNNAGGKLIYKATFTDATPAILGWNYP